MPVPHASPVLGPDAVRRLRDALSGAEYDVAGVATVLGTRASAALARNETVPGLLATTGGSALETLTRLWPLQRPVPVTAAQAALPGVLGALVAGGLLARDTDTVRAVVDVRPYGDDEGDWWVVADLTPGMDGDRPLVPADHVLGVNAASSTLAQLTVRAPVGRALDLGTGCGVQALHLSRHAHHVVGTDVAPRCLAMARLTAALNGQDWDLREGDLYAPVSGETFDLVVSNPPFVVSPGGRHAYRDSGLAGDEVSRRVVVEGARHLAPGGTLQVLANWVHRTGEDWRERLASWVGATGCDAWVLQREVQDPAAYVEIWLRDSGEWGSPGYRRAYEDWLRDRPDQAAVLAARVAARADVVQEQHGPPGAEDPAYVVLRQQRGLCRARTVSTAQAALVGACDASVTVGVLVDAVARVLGTDPEVTRADLVPFVRDAAAGNGGQMRRAGARRKARLAAPTTK